MAALPMTRLRLLALKGCLLLLLGLPSVAVAQQSCTQELEEAETQYVEGNFEEALRLATNCLEQTDVPDTSAVEAYRLIGLAHLRMDSLEAAREAIANIFEIEPRYEADPVEDPPEYVSLVAIVRRERGPFEEPAEEPSWFQRNWGWVAAGGGVVLSGIVALLAGGGGGGGGGEPLPPPPPPPN